MITQIPNIIKRTDKEISAIVNTDVSVISDIREHSINSGGKRIRAILNFLIGKMLGADENNLIKVGAICEIIHTATLLHDDVIDNNGMRRKQKSAKSMWGNKTSILTGDYFLARALKEVVKLKDPKLIILFSDVIENLVKGELAHMKLKGNPLTSIEAYNEIISNKTASLFIASCVSAGMLSNVNNGLLDDLHDFGYNLGMLFQIRDDLIDYTKEEKEIGKVRFNDLINKTPSYPIILLYKKAPKEIKEKIIAIMNKDKIENKDENEILSSIKEYKIDDEIKQEIISYHKKALDIAAKFGNSEFSNALSSVSGNLVNF